MAMQFTKGIRGGALIREGIGRTKDQEDSIKHALSRYICYCIYSSVYKSRQVNSHTYSLDHHAAMHHHTQHLRLNQMQFQVKNHQNFDHL